MFRIHQKSHGARLGFADKLGRPESRSKGAGDAVWQSRFIHFRRQQNFSAVFQNIQSVFVQIFCYVNISLGSGLVGRINPKVIIIFHIAQGNGKLQLLRFLNLRQRNGNLPRVCDSSLSKDRAGKASLGQNCIVLRQFPSHLPFQILRPVVGQHQGSRKVLRIGPAEFLCLQKSYFRAEEGGERFRIREIVRFRISQGIHHSHQGCALAAEILDTQQGNTAHIFCPQGRFDLHPVSQSGKHAAGIDVIFHFLIGNTHSFNALFYQLQVSGLQNACIAVQLREHIREYLELSHFKAESRHSGFRGCPIHRLLIVYRGGRIGLIDKSAHAGINSLHGGAVVNLSCKEISSFRRNPAHCRVPSRHGRPRFRMKPLFLLILLKYFSDCVRYSAEQRKYFFCSAQIYFCRLFTAFSF